MRQNRYRTIFPLALVPILVGCPPPPQTVANVDIEQYLGRWYQVAGYPFFPTNDLYSVSAEYALLPNGNVSVLNKGFEGGFDGPMNTIAGEARIVDPQTNAKLAVRFPEILGGIFEGQYWIIRLDEENYTYAVVTDSRRRTLFILSRTPTVEDAFLVNLVSGLEQDGFDPDRIVTFPQRESQ